MPRYAGVCRRSVCCAACTEGSRQLMIDAALPFPHGYADFVHVALHPSGSIRRSAPHRGRAASMSRLAVCSIAAALPRLTRQSGLRGCVRRREQRGPPTRDLHRVRNGASRPGQPRDIQVDVRRHALSSWSGESPPSRATTACPSSHPPRPLRSHLGRLSGHRTPGATDYPAADDAAGRYRSASPPHYRDRRAHAVCTPVEPRKAERAGQAGGPASAFVQPKLLRGSA